MSPSPTKSKGPRFVKADKVPEQRDKTPEKRGASPARERAAISVDNCHLIDGGLERKEIYGVGRNFYRELGVGAFRTGGEMKMRADVPTLMRILRKNIVEACQDPEHCVRLFVQGSKFWFTDVSGDELCDQILRVADSSTTARELRTQDHPDDMAPVAICVCEPREDAADGSPQTVVQWLFRHDVIDGWRSLRYLFTLAYEEKVMTYDKLRHRFELKKAKAKKANMLVKVGRAAGKALAVTALSPMALVRLANISRAPSSGERKKFYAHVVCDLEHLKAMGREQKLGGLGNVLSASILEAYWVADPTVKRANVANAVLFNPDSPHGNHMGLKICSVPRSGSTMRKTAKALGQPSQGVADALVVGVSRAYALGHLPKRVNSWLEERQKGLDFLVSSLPGCDTSTPAVSDLHVCREFTNWAPNIVYCLGVCGNLCMDFYWEVRPSFDEAAFLKELTTTLGAKRFHTELPAMY